MKEIDESFVQWVVATLGPERRAISDQEVTQNLKEITMKLSTGSPMCEYTADHKKDSGQQSDRKQDQDE